MATFTERIALLISADSKGAIQPLDQLAKKSKETESSFDKMSKSMGISSQALKTGLVAGAAALVGTGLVSYLKSTVIAFTDGAKAAGDLAAATGGTVEEVSRMQAALEDAGVSADAAAGMLTKFTTVAGTQKGVDTLKALNVELVQGKGGATDYAATMIKAADAILEIGDSAERNTRLVALFGKAGAKAFQDMIASGATLSEAMAAVSDARIFTGDDVAKAYEFDAAMDTLAATAQTFGRELGRTLVPMVNALLTAVTPLVGAFASLDGTTVLLAATFAGLALGQAKVVAAVGLAAAGLRTLGNAVIKPLVVDYAGLTIAAGASAKAIDASTAAATRGRSAGLVSGLTKGILGVTIAWEVASRAVGAYNEKLKATAEATSVITDDTVKGLQESLSWWERSGLEIANAFNIKRLQFWKSPEEVDSQIIAENLREEKAALDAAAEAQGAYAVAAQKTQVSQKDLNNAMTEFLFPQVGQAVVTQEELAASIDEAAEAAYRQETATNAVKDAMDAAIVTAEELADATLAAFTADIAHERALKARRDAVAEAVKLAKDEKATRDDVRESILKVSEASLQAAQSYVAEKTAALEAAGEFVSATEKRTLLIDSLKRQLDAIPKSLPDARAAISELIKDLEAAEVGPIKIAGVQFKEGTTAEQVEKLKADIAAAFASGDKPLAVELQSQLDSLKVPPMPVTLVDASGEPLTGETKISIGVDLTGIETAKSQLTEMAGDKEVKFQTTVHNVQNTENVLNGLKGDREVKFNTVVRGDDHTKRVLDGLAGDREVKFNTVVRNVENTENVLNGLDNSRDVYIQVHLTGVSAARSTLDSLAPRSRMGTYLNTTGPTAMTVAAPVVYNQTFSIDVSGAGSPSTTAREIDRYVRRAGDRSRVSVS